MDFFVAVGRMNSKNLKRFHIRLAKIPVKPRPVNHHEHFLNICVHPHVEINTHVKY